MVIPDEADIPDDWRHSVVAIGNFDGVHLGHQHLLAVARERAGVLGCRWGMVTFEPHPRSVFRPDQPVFRLTPLDLKARLVKGLGGDFVAPLTFDKTLASREAEDFVESVLVKRLAIAHVVTGYDFHFGRGRKGSPSTMQQLGEEFGFGVTVVDQVTDDDGLAPYSSSGIRASLRHGLIREAAHDLGYWWTVTGTVVEGDRRGRTIGFPTANIVLDTGCEPHEGIFAVRVRDLDAQNGRLLPGAAYIGRRPTFDTERSFLEIHLLDFEGDLYGHRLSVEFLDFIRPDETFDAVEDLVAQMNRDCEEIARILAAIQADDPMTAYPLGKLQAKGRL